MADRADILYPMRRRTVPWVTPDDVNIRMEPSPVGRLAASMIISEEMLHKIGARALECAVDEMGKAAAYAHQPEIHSAVQSLLIDSQWAKPIIEDELRKAVREFVMSLWNEDEKQAQREWFDLFAQKLRGETP